MRTKGTPAGPRYRRSGEAAGANRPKAMSEIAKDQLAWERERAKVQDPLIEKIVNQQIGSGDANAARSEEQWKIYRNLFAPLEERMVRDANDFDSEERKERMAARGRRRTWREDTRARWRQTCAQWNAWE